MYASGEQLVTAWVKYVSVFLCYFEDDIFKERKANYYRYIFISIAIIPFPLLMEHNYPGN